MNISKIYEKYKIMPQLQLHMLRVAAVASLISDNFEKTINKNNIIEACLLHDMGNIIKSKIGIFKEHYVEGVDYWQKVKEEFIKTYGDSDHKATENIINELGVNEFTNKLVTGFGFAQTPETYSSKSIERKICVYSDMRVSPKGITSLSARLAEVRERYSTKQKGIYTTEQFNTFFPLWVEIEIQIFSNSKIKPEEITEEKAKATIEKLKNYEIITGK